MESPDRNYYWTNWIMVGGFHKDTISDFTDLNPTTSNYMYGLSFDIELRCKIEEVLCMDSMDFENNNLAGAMAIAIQNKTASILGKWILNGGKLSRLNIIDTESFLADINNWEKVYMDMINYIMDEVDLSVNDCLVCKDFVEMTRRGILA